MKTIIFLIIFGLLCPAISYAQEDISLPKPQITGGIPLMQALNNRRSTRSFSTKELPQQLVSDLLWAAFGINRPKDDMRTAPSAMNLQEINIYVAKKDGLYLYEPRAHALKFLLADDLRIACGKQDFLKQAPIVLIYVADYRKLNDLGNDKDLYAAADTGFISENVYLFCSSENLATVILGWVDKEALAAAMKLEDDKKIIFTQPVGYPLN